MMHFEPLPLLEAHFFLAGKQAGFSAEEYFKKKNALNPPPDSPMERYIKILSEVESRLAAAVTVSEDELAALYGELGSGSGDPAFQGDYFTANIVICGIECFSDEKNCFQNIQNGLCEIPDRIAQRILGDAPEESFTAVRAVELIAGSELSNESKLLLIDLVLRPQKYADMLERALLPVAEEFRRCRELVEPLVALYRRAYGHIESAEQENELFLPMMKPGSQAVERYDIYPLISYFYVIIFSFTSADNSKIFGGIGVMYEVLKKHYRTDIDMNAKLASIMNTLGSKSRFDIIARLSEGPQYGRELAANLGLTPATVSHHINALLAEGLIKLDTSGKRIYYSLNYDCTEAFVEKLQQLLSRKK